MRRDRFGLVLAIVFLSTSLSACFKKHHTNEFALLHQRACIESLESKDYARALIHCELCLEYDRAMPECLNGVGLIALSNSDEEKARDFFTRALRQDNDFTQARNNLGVIYFSHGEFESALTYFDRALEIDPSNSDARYNSGLSHVRLGQRLRAQNYKEESIRHFLRARDQMKKLLAIEPTYYAALRDIGLIDLNLYDLSDYEAGRQEFLLAAKAAFNQCVEAQSDDDGCHEGLGQVYLEEGRYDLSFKEYFLCLTFAPSNSDCRNGIVVAYEKSAHAEGGYKSFASLIKRDSRNALAHEAFCAVLFERNLNEEGVKECEQALRLKPNLCSAQFRLAEYFTSVLNAERASRHCHAFLSCDAQAPLERITRCQQILATIKRK